MPLLRLNTWIASDVQVNAPVSAVRAGETGRTLFVTHISAGFLPPNAGKRLDFTDGGDVIMSWPVYDHLTVDFPFAVPITPGNAAELALEASGQPGEAGAVNMAGFSEESI